MIDISIVIVNYKTPSLTRKAVASVHEVKCNAQFAYEIIVVDNDSRDGSYEQLKSLEDGKTKVYKTSSNCGFGSGNNYGVQFCKGQYLFFLNSDTILQPAVLCKMLCYIQTDPSIGAISCIMKDAMNNPLVASHEFENCKTLIMQTIVKPLLPRVVIAARNKHHHLRGSKNGCWDCDWVSGAGLLINKRLFEQIGGWNEEFFMYMEDEELCYRIHKEGKRVVMYPEYGVQHLLGASGGSAFVAFERYKSKFIYFQKVKAKPMWLIRILLLIQARQYTKNLSKQERREVIRKLKELQHG